MSNAAAKDDKRGFFTIYKPGQGKWVRWGTVAGMALAAALGTYWIGYTEQSLAQAGKAWQFSAAILWILLWAWLTFWFVNSPKYGEFMIMTESEMRKVSWPSRKEVYGATWIVICGTVIMAGFLAFCDVVFLNFFNVIGISEHSRVIARVD